jgi:hypothetical protein
MARTPKMAQESIADRLFLVVPDSFIADEPAERGGAEGGGLVGVVVRGALQTERGRSELTGQSHARLLADLQQLIASGSVIAAEITDRAEDAGGAPLPPQLRMLNDSLVAIRNRLVHGPLRGDDVGNELRAITDLPLLYTAAGENLDHEAGEVSLAVLDTLIETAQTQLMLLRHIRASSASARRERVTLQTPTGPLEYTLPLSRDDTYSSTAVSKILSPTGKGHRSIAQHRRRANELLGLKIGNQYRYPKFQIDPLRHEIRPIVAYANRCMECDADPWGTLDWWYSEDEALASRRPVDLLDSGELTRESVDFAIKRSQQGMD